MNGQNTRSREGGLYRLAWAVIGITIIQFIIGTHGSTAEAQTLARSVGAALSASCAAIALGTYIMDLRGHEQSKWLVSAGCGAAGVALGCQLLWLFAFAMAN